METIDFISNKFDEYEKDRKEKEEIIKTLEDYLINMSKQVKNKNEKTDYLCITTINNTLNYQLLKLILSIRIG